MTAYWTPGAQVQLQVNAHSAGFLAAWFDWNDDGLFQQTEQEIAHTITGPGVIDLSITIPAAEGYLTGQQVKARFRFYAAEPLLYAPSATETFDGFGGVGEVEDYVWAFSPTAATVRGVAATGSALPLLTTFVLLALLAASWRMARRSIG
ncbi:MAG: GEVED domain-containing protein [Anaerolineae bacterium]